MKNSVRKYALIAGISLVIMAIAAGFAYGYVYNSLVIPDKPSETLQNLLSNKPLFIGGIAGWFSILICDILVAWSLYHFFKPVNRKVSLATGWIRMIYSAMLAFAIYHLLAVIPMLNAASESVDTIKLQFGTFEKSWSVGLIVFGFHLAGLGYLSLKSGFVPKILGWLLLFAGVCYTLIHAAKNLIPSYADQISSIEMILSFPMALGEIALAFWLIIKGGKKFAT